MASKLGWKYDNEQGIYVSRERQLSKLKKVTFHKKKSWNFRNIRDSFRDNPGISRKEILVTLYSMVPVAETLRKRQAYFGWPRNLKDNFK
jgi:hypothetical protein